MIKLCCYFLKVEGYRTGMGDCSVVQVLATQLWELDFRSSELTQMPVDMIVPCSSRIRGWRQRIPRTSLLLRLAIVWVLGFTERLCTSEWGGRVLEDNSEQPGASSCTCAYVYCHTCVPLHTQTFMDMYMFTVHTWTKSDTGDKENYYREEKHKW